MSRTDWKVFSYFQDFLIQGIFYQGMAIVKRQFNFTSIDISTQTRDILRANDQVLPESHQVFPLSHQVQILKVIKNFLSDQVLPKSDQVNSKSYQELPQ